MVERDGNVVDFKSRKIARSLGPEIDPVAEGELFRTLESFSSGLTQEIALKTDQEFPGAILAPVDLEQVNLEGAKNLLSNRIDRVVFEEIMRRLSQSGVDISATQKRAINNFLQHTHIEDSVVKPPGLKMIEPTDSPRVSEQYDLIREKRIKFMKELLGENLVARIEDLRSRLKGGYESEEWKAELAALLEKLEPPRVYDVEQFLASAEMVAKMDIRSGHDDLPAPVRLDRLAEIAKTRKAFKIGDPSNVVQPKGSMLKYTTDLVSSRRDWLAVEGTKTRVDFLRKKIAEILLKQDLRVV